MFGMIILFINEDGCPTFHLLWKIRTLCAVQKAKVHGFLVSGGRRNGSRLAARPIKTQEAKFEMAQNRTYVMLQPLPLLPCEAA